jgi:predicted nucleotidyltransferase
MYNVNLDKVAHVLACVPNVLAAWVFGSAQEGRIHAGSDLDIGVLFVTPPALDELADLWADVQEAVQFDNIDLVVLNTSSPVLRFEAVSGRRASMRKAWPWCNVRWPSGLWPNAVPPESIPFLAADNPLLL